MDHTAVYPGIFVQYPGFQPLEFPELGQDLQLYGSHACAVLCHWAGFLQPGNAIFTGKTLDCSLFDDGLAVRNTMEL